MIEHPYENDSPRKSYLARKLNHPFKRSLFKYSIISDILFGLLLILYGINAEIYGIFADFVLIIAITGLPFSIFGFWSCFGKTRVKHIDFQKSSLPLRSLEKEFIREYQKYLQILPALPKLELKLNKKIIYVLICGSIIGMAIGSPGFLYQIKNDTSPTIATGIFLFSWIVLVFTLLWYLDVIEKSRKYKIPQQKQIQRNFLEYYKQIGLDCIVNAGYYRNPNYGIEIRTSPNTLEQTDAVQFIKNAQGILYIEQYASLFFYYCIHLIIAIPFILGVTFDSKDRNVFWVGIILGGILIGLFSWITYKVVTGIRLEKKTHIVLGIYIASYKEKTSSRGGGYDDDLF